MSSRCWNGSRSPTSGGAAVVGATRVSDSRSDTLVRVALEAVSSRVLGEPRFEARIEKRIPVAAGLGGGSSDAGNCNPPRRNRCSRDHFPPMASVRIAAALGRTCPSFWDSAVGTTDGTELEPIDLPRDYWVVLVLPAGVVKSRPRPSTRHSTHTAASAGSMRGAGALRAALSRLERASDLGKLPPNDLAARHLR